VARDRVTRGSGAGRVLTDWILVISVGIIPSLYFYSKQATGHCRATRVDVQYTPQRADGSLGSPVSALLDCAIN
jgi:hypothetical protein